MSEPSRVDSGRPADRSDPVWDVEGVTSALPSRPRNLNRREVSRMAHVSLRSAQKFWRALGFPLVNHDEPVFTEADVEALRTVARLVRRDEIDEATALQLTRAFARTADRLASWQVQLVAESIAGGRPGVDGRAAEPPQDDTARATAEYFVGLADDLQPLLVYAWRRHLADTVSRLLIDATTEASEEGTVRHIGFADIVSFTSLVRESSERDLAVVVKEFEVLCADIVTAHGGRIVKTVGDAILFANVNAAAAAATALDLAEAIHTDPFLPEVRVGLTRGRVLLKLGDVFGETVNRAARLTPLADPGTVLVDEAMAGTLTEVPGFALTALPPQYLRGIGRVEPFLLARAETPTRRLAVVSASQRKERR